METQDNYHKSGRLIVNLVYEAIFNNASNTWQMWESYFLFLSPRQLLFLTFLVKNIDKKRLMIYKLNDSSFKYIRVVGSTINYD